ncbi:MAG: family 78 glycoside hydrolase catalytic domain [Eubacteriales bacterium]
MNHSKWIWCAEGAQADEYADFRARFVNTGCERTFLEISAGGNYAAYVNGKLAAFGQYPDYPFKKYYDRVDISEFVTDGENLLEITAWHIGEPFFTYYPKPAGVRFEVLEGEKELLISGCETQSRLSPVYAQHLQRKVSDQLGFSFRYDSTADVSGDYHPSCEVKGLCDEMHLRPIKKLLLEERMMSETVLSGTYFLPKHAEGMRSADIMQYSSISNTYGAWLERSNDIQSDGADGVYFICDMGEETSGFLSFDIEVSEECEIRIGWGEHLGDGRCRTAVRNFACEYRAKVGRNIYMNPFLRFGCRYVQIFAACKRAKLQYLGICPTPYPQNEIPFSTGNALRDRIYRVSVNTLRHCMHEHYEDCPWREQSLYALDSRNEMLCGYFAFDDTSFPRACLDLICDGRREDGILYLCYPSGNSIAIPSFSLALFLSMREYYDHTADIEFVREKYPVLKELLSVFTDRMNDDGLVESFFGEGSGYWNFYEWSDGLSGRYNETEKLVEAPLNAFLSLALENIAHLSSVLGLHEDAQQYARMQESLNAAIRAHFFDAKRKLFFTRLGERSFHTLTNALCLLCGAADGLDDSEIIITLLSNGGVSDDGYVVPNTLSMNCYRFDALLRKDAKYAEQILQEIDRVYLEMLCQGATTFFETADGEKAFAGAGSLCHGWSAIPVYYYHILLK